jgi:hypothetical protein
VHPTDESDGYEFYLMCDDLMAEITVLASKGVQRWEVQEDRSGRSPGSEFPVEAKWVSISKSP